MFENDSNYLDQHFLTDERIINKFIDICNLNRDDIVVEIGPGKGIITRFIEPKVKELILIEKDVRLKEYLDNIPNVKVIYANVLDINIPKCNKIITALPYSIIEPFIYKLIYTDFDELYMIMGSTYVDSVINKEINNLSLLTNVFFDAKKYFNVGPSYFYPKPKTMSAVIKLTKKKAYSKLDLIFKNMYLLDDKKIKNALMESLIKINNLTKRESKELIESLNINEEMLTKKFNIISNEELKILYEKVSLIVND